MRNRKNMSAADRAWAAEDDRRQAENQRDWDELREQDRAAEMKLPVWSSCEDRGQWFWAVWKKREDCRLQPDHWGRATTEAKAKQAAEQLAGEQGKWMTPTAAAAFRHLKNKPR